MLSKMHNFFLGDKRRTATIIAVALFLCVLIVFGVVYAKYVKSVENDGTVIMKEFYFTSDLLDGKQHTLSAGTNEISFTLSNHIDDLRYSEVDINYSVKISDSNAVITNNEGVLIHGSTSDKTITISNLVPGNSYTITATGEGGYHQELTATIVVPEVTANLYYYLDTSNVDFVVLTVWAQGFSGDVVITTPNSGVIPDNTDVVMREVKVGDTFTDSVNFKDNTYSSRSYRFFGSAASVNEFVVSGKSGAAVVSAEVKNPN